MDEYCLEYSPKQKSFHFSGLEEIKKCNMRMLSRGDFPQYFIIGGPGSYAEMKSLCVSLQQQYPEIFKQFRMKEIV
jgi:hypothetical protein